jgi:hypothetical protein
MGTGRILMFSRSHGILRGTCCDSVIAPQTGMRGGSSTECIGAIHCS